MATPLSLLQTRFVRFVRREGAIRLDYDNDEGLPWVLSGQDTQREGYTNVHLLGECIAASIWNALCLLYLVNPFSSSSPPPSLILDSTPDATYLYALTLLTLVPLAIGVAAGSAALWSDDEPEREARKRRRGGKIAAVWVGTVGCIASMWPLLRLAVQDWDAQYQAEMAVILVVLQAFLVKSGSDSSFPSDAPDPLCIAQHSLLVPVADAAVAEKEALKKREEADEETVRNVVPACA